MNLTDHLSKFVTYGEAIFFETAKRLGIDNTPTAEHLENLVALSNNVFDKVREFCGGPLSGKFYRCPELNKNIPGADPHSQHMIGQAVDIDCDKYGHGTNLAVFERIRDTMEFDELIFEFGTDEHPEWVHVSYRLPKYGPNRKIVKRAIKNPDGTTTYKRLS